MKNFYLHKIPSYLRRARIYITLRKESIELYTRKLYVRLMIIALINAIVGMSMSFFVGLQIFDMAFADILLSVLISNGSALVAMLLTLKIERTAWMARFKLKGFFGSWSILAGVYFGLLLSLCPPLREVGRLVYFLLPLLFSTGFSIIFFGPIQDWLVSRDQKRARTITRNKRPILSSCNKIESL